MKEAPFPVTRSHPGSLCVSCPRLARVSLPAGELWTRVWRWERSLQNDRETEKSAEDREPCGPHWEQNCSHFHKVKEFAWRAGIETFCRTIFSSPGGHPAPLWNICKRQTVSPVRLCFCSLFDQSLGFSTWPLFWACLSLLSPGPALHLYFWHLPP